jgi:ABC-type iron transport system FetAB ATPase subunit
MATAIYMFKLGHFKSVKITNSLVSYALQDPPLTNSTKYGNLQFPQQGNDETNILHEFDQLDWYINSTIN